MIPKSNNNFCINLVISKFKGLSIGSVEGPSRVSWGPPGVHRISIRVNQEVSQDQLEVRQGICSGSVLSIGANGESSFESSMGTALQIETLKLISWSWSGTGQESIRSLSGVCQESVRSLSGVGHESVRSQSGVGQESVRSRSGVCQELVRSRSGVGQESVKSRSRVSQESVRSQSGVSQESVRSPSGVCQGS